MSSSYLLSLVKGKMYINIHVYEDENDSHPIEQKVELDSKYKPVFVQKAYCFVAI